MFSMRNNIIVFCLVAVCSLKSYAQNNTIFYGGGGSGGDVFCYAQADAILNNNIFTGGIASGISFGCLGTLMEVPLPIKLLFFTAFVQEKSVLLKWATASEINNDFFTVYRSRDAIEWYEVVKVSGAGNSSNTIYYQTYDYKPFSGLSYYRLKQTDFDGKYEYSNIIAVNFKNENGIVQIYPNPAKDKFYIVTRINSEFNMVILDAYGKIVFNDFNSKEISTQNLSNGMYIVRITFTEKETTTLKLIVNK